ncbi:hypothetical protein PybrP1_007786 [[Pythium] brassicae (nom. inval.)]|nr:hypothetical protein PybrP1_007786 [[Pythium] brassicae (nom. inval.)]
MAYFAVRYPLRTHRATHGRCCWRSSRRTSWCLVRFSFSLIVRDSPQAQAKRGDCSPQCVCARAGPKRLFVSYYRKRVYADLLPDGSIRFKDLVYTSPVPCALQMKRTLNPCAYTGL